MLGSKLLTIIILVFYFFTTNWNPDVILLQNYCYFIRNTAGIKGRQLVKELDNKKCGIKIVENYYLLKSDIHNPLIAPSFLKVLFQTLFGLYGENNKIN